MSEYERASFSVERNSGGDLRIMWTGTEDYAGLLRTAFPTIRFSSIFEDKYGNFNYGVFAKGISEEDAAQARAFCRALSSAIWLRDGLDVSLALSMHSHYVNGKYPRTFMGELVHGAKPYDNPVQTSHIARAEELAACMASFIHQCPMYGSATAIAAVPPYTPEKSFDLPTHVVAEIASLTKKVDVSQAVRKIRATRAMKDCNTDEERAANIRGAFEADPAVVRGMTIILVDDIYDSGQSMNEVGRALRSAGASAILGLTATKTQT